MPDNDFGPLALAAARAGVAAIQGVRASGALNTAFKTAGHDLVTAADRAAEAAVIAVIRAARPDDVIVGEESGEHAGTTGVRWLVDPLDGTANFVYGRDDHAVSVGVEIDGVPVAGAIIRPTDGRWGMAGDGRLETGGGAGPQPGRMNRDADIAHALVCFGMPYPLPHRRRALGVISELVLHIRGVRIVGSAAGDLLSIVHGGSDAFVGFGLADWDTAAGVALVTAAGGAVVRLTAPEFGIVVAGVPAVVADLVALLERCLAGAV